ncbi:MAG TPA: diguanylate cyclase [Steroidobacteraceae bacterium]|nr:diguanylate cyclase [Steroidobacteraceae bacterium]
MDATPISLFAWMASPLVSQGTVALLIVAVVAALGRAMWLHTRIADRTRELEAELTQRRRVEAELEAIRSDLERRVGERTAALEARNEELTRLRLALETANQRLKRLVAVDALTGIANRRHFDRVLERELRRARREHLPISLIFLDLDEFKRFNDTYGHARGDEVLRQVAQTLDETFRRGGDLVARYGGEEFAVILPGVDGKRAALYAERLRRRVWRLSIGYDASDVSDRVTISGGVATVEPPNVSTPDELLHAADQALYRAKCLGRNRITSASTASLARLNIAS